MIESTFPPLNNRLKKVIAAYLAIQPFFLIILTFFTELWDINSELHEKTQNCEEKKAELRDTSQSPFFKKSELRDY